MKQIKDKIYNIGADDLNSAMFESQYKVPNGMAYNSYAIVDEKVAVLDTIDVHVTDIWLKNLDEVLNGRKIDYLVISHMEPDHSANILKLIEKYKGITIVGNNKTFQFMSQFFDRKFDKNIIVVKEGDELNLGEHNLRFINAPMCHWPEVMVTYDSFSKVLFTADAFGKFGANSLTDSWDDEARRYYFNIVGKYGIQVQSLLKKVSNLKIETLCPLHGPVLTENLSHYIELYDTWSKYEAEVDGVFIAYTSVYGNTKKAVEMLADLLIKNGTNVLIADLTRTDMSENLSNAFRFSKLILATTTYNAGVFPAMEDFLNHIKAKNFQNKKIGMIENGTWVPLAVKGMNEILEGFKNLEILEPIVSIKSALSDESRKQIKELAFNICK